MISLIIAYGVKGYGNGEIVELNRFVDGSIKPNSVYAFCFCVNEVINSWIYGSITGSMIGNIFGKNIIFEMWQSLERSYVSISKIGIIEVKLKL